MRDHSYIRRYRQFRLSPWGEAFETVGLAILFALVIRTFVFQAFYIPSGSMLQTLAPFDHILVEKLSYAVRGPGYGEIMVFDFAHAAPGANPARPAHAAVPVPSLPAEVDPNREYIKRVIGREGDEIEFRSAQLHRNGRPVSEPYVTITTAPGFDAARSSVFFAASFPGRKISFEKRGVLVDGRPLDEILPASLPPASIVDRRPANFVRLSNGRIGVMRIRVPEGRLYLLGDNRLESADSRFFGFVDEGQARGRALVTYWPFRRIQLL